MVNPQPPSDENLELLVSLILAIVDLDDKGIWKAIYQKYIGEYVLSRVCNTHTLNNY